MIQAVRSSRAAVAAAAFLLLLPIALGISPGRPRMGAARAQEPGAPAAPDSTASSSKGARSLGVTPPEATQLTLDDSIELALAESYDARNLLLRLKRAEQNESAARGRFKTFADLDLLAPSYAEQFTEVNLPDQPLLYNSSGRGEVRAQLSVNQPLPTNGQLGLQGELSQINTNVYVEDTEERFKDNRFFTSLRLDFAQPLFVPNDLKLGLERAELELEQAQMQYTRTQLDVIFNVTSSFFAYYRTLRSLEIAQAEVTQQQRNYDLAKTKFDAGLIPEVEALQMEVDLATIRNELLAAQGAVSRAADNFKLTIGLDLGEPVVVEADLVVHTFEVDPDLAIEHALKNRAEIRQAAIDHRLAEITVQETDARSTIRGDVTAFYDIIGVSDPDLEFGTSTGKLLSSSFDDIKRRPPNRGFTFSLSVPLWDSGVNAAEVAAAKLTLKERGLDEEESRRRVVQQVNAAITSLEESRRRLDVLGRSEEVAQRSYEISLARFENGEITSQELALDRDRLTQSRQSYLGAYIEYQLATAELKRQTLYDFETGHSLVKE